MRPGFPPEGGLSGPPGLPGEAPPGPGEPPPSRGRPLRPLARPFHGPPLRGRLDLAGELALLREWLLPTGGPFLDVGTGTGVYREALGEGMVGVDPSPAFLKVAQRRRPGAYLLAHGERLPFREGAFSGVAIGPTWNEFLDPEGAARRPGASSGPGAALRPPPPGPRGLPWALPSHPGGPPPPPGRGGLPGRGPEAGPARPPPRRGRVRGVKRLLALSSPSSRPSARSTGPSPGRIRGGRTWTGATPSSTPPRGLRPSSSWCRGFLGGAPTSPSWPSA